MVAHDLADQPAAAVAAQDELSGYIANQHRISAASGTQFPGETLRVRPTLWHEEICRYLVDNAAIV